MATHKIASGKTTPGATAWQVYSPNGIYVDVNTSGGKFSAPPVYITSIGGTSSHWATTGATSVYSATATGVSVCTLSGQTVHPLLQHGCGSHAGHFAQNRLQQTDISA